MSIIKKEDILCYMVDGKVCCPDCMTDEPEEENIVLAQQKEEYKMYFCDFCGKRL